MLPSRHKSEPNILVRLDIFRKCDRGRRTSRIVRPDEKPPNKKEGSGGYGSNGFPLLGKGLPVSIEEHSMMISVRYYFCFPFPRLITQVFRSLRSIPVS